MNFAEHLSNVASNYPYKRAVVFPYSRDKVGYVGYTQLTYQQLEAKANIFACGLSSIGVQEGMRVSFLVKPGLDFLPLIYALFKIGAVPVLIDPGMGRKNLLNCISRSKPEALIGVPQAFIAKFLFPKYFRSISIKISTGQCPFPTVLKLNSLSRGARTFRCASKDPQNAAAIVFTTGSTGPPKGVVFTHGMFCAQTEWIQNAYQITPNDIDMPGFSLFAIFSIAIGMTVIIPDMDPTCPANADPRKIIEAIENHGVTFSFGSPALWNNVSQFCVDHNIVLPTLRKILMAGAPIPPFLHQRMLEKILPKGAEIHTPYGATESLLVSTFTGSNVLSETKELTQRGKGYCVGRPLSGVTLKIIKIVDNPISKFSDIEERPLGEKGEIIIKSAVVSSSYFELPEQDALHKIREDHSSKNSPIWHRIGDIGYLDKQGRLWFCGRKAHRVETGKKTLYTVCCEAIFNEHPWVFRSALVGIGEDRYRQTPAIVIEPVKGRFPKTTKAKTKFKNQLLELANKSPLTQEIHHILFHPSFPVDIRHNAKIFREKLANWAQEQLKL